MKGSFGYLCEDCAVATRSPKRRLIFDEFTGPERVKVSLVALVHLLLDEAIEPRVEPDLLLAHVLNNPIRILEGDTSRANTGKELF
jgi:hypothetical protein